MTAEVGLYSIGFDGTLVALLRAAQTELVPFLHLRVGGHRGHPYADVRAALDQHGRHPPITMFCLSTEIEDVLGDHPVAASEFATTCALAVASGVPRVRLLAREPISTWDPAALARLLNRETPQLVVEPHTRRCMNDLLTGLGSLPGQVGVLVDSAVLYASRMRTGSPVIPDLGDRTLLWHVHMDDESEPDHPSNFLRVVRAHHRRLGTPISELALEWTGGDRTWTSVARVLARVRDIHHGNEASV